MDTTETTTRESLPTLPWLIHSSSEITTDTFDVSPTKQQEEHIYIKDDQLLMIPYILIGFFGTAGNTLVIVVFVWSKNMKKRPANWFILTQSVCDLMVSLLTFIKGTTNINPFGSIVADGISGELHCRLWKSDALLWSVLAMSTVNLVAMTFDLYMQLVQPLRHKVYFSVNIVLWVFILSGVLCLVANLLFAVPTSLVFEKRCLLFYKWPNHTVQRVSGAFFIIAQFFIPVIILFVIYAGILISLKTRIVPAVPTISPVSPPQIIPATNNTTNMIGKAKINILATFVAVTTAFVVCWLPSQTDFLLFNLEIGNIDLNSTYHVFFIILTLSNSSLNPIIYIFKYKQFRFELKRMIKKDMAIGLSSDA